MLARLAKIYCLRDWIQLVSFSVIGKMWYRKDRTYLRRRTRTPALNWDDDYIKRRQHSESNHQPRVPAAAYILAHQFRRVRQARGDKLKDVAAKTFVHTRVLEAIEAGRLEELPGGLYLRNYFRLYARYLHIDDTVVQQAFSPFPAITNELPQAGIRNETFAMSVDVAQSSGLPKLGEYLLYIVLSKPERINVIGDLEEDYEVVKLKFGDRAAKLFFYNQVFTSLLPFSIKSFLRGLFGPEDF